LYDFTAVNPHHRQETFNSDEYGHLVAVTDTGQFVAYCEYAFCRAEWAQSGRRRGWIEYLGVRPENRRQGLGRAALLAGLRQLQAAGAETALLGTNTANKSAVNLYETTGFTRLATVETTAYQKSCSGVGAYPCGRPQLGRHKWAGTRHCPYPKEGLYQQGCDAR
jgi:ribosomal protein S18 acetylase RimI-like enzyme